MRWRGRRRSNAGFWGFGAVGPQDQNRENERCTMIRYSPSNAPCQSGSARHTSPDSTTTRPSHRG
eukprot:2688654-Prymnesium_polylepis.1